MSEEVKRSRIILESQPYSRYRNLERIRYDDEIEIIETRDRINIKRSSNDSYFIVTDEFRNRLDLIAYRFYHNTRLWWVIAYANNIIDPFDIPVGLRLRVPPLAVALSEEIL